MSERAGDEDRVTPGRAPRAVGWLARRLRQWLVSRIVVVFCGFVACMIGGYLGWYLFGPIMTIVLAIAGGVFGTVGAAFVVGHFAYRK